MSHQQRKIMHNMARQSLREDGYRQINKKLKIKGEKGRSLFAVSWKNAATKAIDKAKSKTKQKTGRRAKA